LFSLSDRNKQWIKGLGFLLSLVAVGFVATRFVQYWEELELSGLGAIDWIALAGLGLVYALISVFLGLAWWKMLLHLKPESEVDDDAVISPFWAVYAYGYSQIGKYLPGNVLHFAGRHVLGMAAGYRHARLIYSTILELALLLVSGLLLTLLLLPVLGLHHGLAALAYALVFVLVYVGLKLRSSIHLSHALALHSLFLLLTGILFVLVLALIDPAFDWSLRSAMLILAAYVLAWLIGMLTPGAPAGLGIREVVLLFLLGPIVNQSELLLAILLSRVVSLTGDLLFFAAAVIVKPKLLAGHWVHD